MTTGMKKILYVDDEELVREAVIDILSLNDFVTIGACDGEQGIELFRKHGDEIGLVLLDYSLPGLESAAVAQRLKEIDPTVQIVLTSGYDPSESSKKFAGIGVAGFIQKPFRPVQLIDQVSAFLKK
jgi:DNA-binding NtrC family response regulator